MLAYTAVDGLRAISRDFDLHWQPDINENLTAGQRDWRISLRAGRQALSAIALLLPFGAAAWLR
jgi:hypothetical protein